MSEEVRTRHLPGFPSEPKMVKLQRLKLLSLLLKYFPSLAKKKKQHF